MNTPIVPSVNCIKQAYPNDKTITGWELGTKQSACLGRAQHPAGVTHQKPLARTVRGSASEAQSRCNGGLWTHRAPALLEADLQPGPRKSHRGRDTSAVL